MMTAKTSFLHILLALLAAGIWLAANFSLPPVFWATALIFLFAAAAVAVRRSSPMAGVAIGLLFFFLGGLRFVAADSLPPDDISHWRGETVTVRGTLSEPCRLAEDARGNVRLRYTLSVSSVRQSGETRSASGGLYVYAYRQRGEAPTARIGDIVEATGKIRLPHGYGNPGQIDTVMLLKSQGITAQLVAGKAEAKVTPQEGYSLRRWLADVRAAYLSSMQAAMPKADAAAIFAMLFGGYGGLKPELLEAFTLTGIIHILSVSGSHISLLAATIAWLGRWLRCPKPLLAMLVISGIAVYSLLAGCVPPVIRSAIMGALAFLALAMERERDARRLLTLTGLTMLIVSPLLLFNISFQLSFAATFGLLYVAPVLRQRLAALPDFLAASLAVSIGAQALSLPFLAWYFNQVSLSSLLANLIAVPIVEFMIVLGLAAGVVSLLLPFVGRVAFVLDSLLLGIVYELTRAMGRLPGSYIYVPTFSFFMSAAYYAAVAFALQPGERRQAICAWCRARGQILLAAIVGAAIFAAVYSMAKPAELAVHFIDVGQGNAALIVTPHGHAFMVDTGGTREQAFDIGSRVDLPYLLHYGVRRLDFILLTHAHEDHAAGTGSLLRKIPVMRVFTSNEGPDAYAHSMALPTSAPEIFRLSPLKSGDRLTLDGVAVDVVYSPSPDSGPAVGNEASNVYRVTYGQASFLFTGDLETGQEEILLKRQPDLHSTVLQVGHHGSATSSSPEFVAAVAPRWSVVSVGANNTFGHPRPEVLSRLKSCGSEIYRTDEDGAIVFCTDGEHMRVESFYGR